MRTKHYATFTTCLLAYLAKQSSRLFVVRAESMLRQKYASSVEIAGGKLKGFFKKSERLS